MSNIVSVSITIPALRSMAREHIKGDRCEHKKKFDVNYDSMAIRLVENRVSLVCTAIAGCDVGCGRDFNIAL